MLFTGVGSLIKRELLNLLRDPKSATMILFPIVLFLTVFVFASNKDVEYAPVVIMNQDQGKHSRELLEDIVDTKIFKDAIYVNSEEELKDKINKEDAFIGILIAQDFSKNIERGFRADMQVVTDGRRTNAATIAYGYLATILGKYQTKLLPPHVHVPSVTVRTWYNPNKEQKWFSITNLICMIIVSQAISLVALSIAREKEQGTFDQLLVSPIKPLGLLVGKTVPSIVIALFMGASIMILGQIFYAIPMRGSYLLMLISMTLYVISVVGIGVCVAAFANTQQQAMLGTFVVQMPMSSLSGLMSPVESIENPIMKLYSHCNPMVYGNRIVKGVMLKDMSMMDAIENIIPIVIVGVVTLVIAAYTFAHKHRIKMF